MVCYSVTRKKSEKKNTLNNYMLTTDHCSSILSRGKNLSSFMVLFVIRSSAFRLGYICILIYYEQVVINHFMLFLSLVTTSSNPGKTPGATSVEISRTHPTKSSGIPCKLLMQFTPNKTDKNLHKIKQQIAGTKMMIDPKTWPHLKLILNKGNFYFLRLY